MCIRDRNHFEDIKGDDCFFCIGTTKQNSPDKNEYKRIERDMPVEIAEISKANSVNSFVYVSSGFADPKNSGAYLRYKGEVEEDLKKLNFSKLGIMRPSFLLGIRKEKRFGEKIGIFFPVQTYYILYALKSFLRGCVVLLHT